jgi:hypothetical protein
MGPDREDFIPAVHKQDGLAADMADKRAAVTEVGKGNALGEVGAARRGCSIFGHRLLPW